MQKANAEVVAQEVGEGQVDLASSTKVAESKVTVNAAPKEKTAALAKDVKATKSKK